MKAVRIAAERVRLSPALFAELVIWRVPTPVPGSAHPYKYSLVLIHENQCVLRYDNERGKGDHRHRAGVEDRLEFSTLKNLLLNFWADVARWRDDNGDPGSPVD